MTGALPDVLAGPILRRAEPEAVCVWIATSAPKRVRVEVSLSREAEESSRLGATPTPIGVGECDTVAFGEHLHVALVRARPAGTEPRAFPTGTLLAYDLELTDPGGGPGAPTAPLAPGEGVRPGGQRLADLGLLSGERSIAYGRLPLPTFLLQRPGTALRLLYGSCRKPHGAGDDCFPVADRVLESTARDVHKRPAVLILTGDQIYADDVALPMGLHVADLARRLTGRDEPLPGIGDVSAIHPGRRGPLLRARAGFTSTEPSNHLVTFGEFAAMYLTVWGPDLWPQRFPPAPPARTPEETASTPPTREEAAALREMRHQADYRDQVRRLQEARPGLPAVRRLLANVPTYMIFDDHEVTDDWNITRRVRTRVEGSPTGRRVVANALAAYWVFQGWGNDPARTEEPLRDVITDHVAGSGSGVAFDKALWAYAEWAYAIPTDPPGLVIDTRTRRAYDTETGPPRLLDDEALADLVATVRRTNAHGELVLVSPAPVVGIDILDETNANLVAPILGTEYLDAEAWGANPRGLPGLLEALASGAAVRRLVVLSGDVHYAFSAEGTFAVEGRVMAVVQLTSSALRNSWLSGAGAAAIARFNPPLTYVDHRLSWRQPPPSQTLMDLQASFDQIVARLRQPVEDPDAIAAAEHIAGQIAAIKARLQRQPLILDAGEAARLGISQPPTWQLRKRYLPHRGYSELSVVPPNNVAEVHIAAGSGVDHILHVCERTRVRAAPARSASLAAPPVTTIAAERELPEAPPTYPCHAVPPELRRLLDELIEAQGAVIGYSTDTYRHGRISSLIVDFAYEDDSVVKEWLHGSNDPAAAAGFPPSEWPNLSFRGSDRGRLLPLEVATTEAELEELRRRARLHVALFRDVVARALPEWGAANAESLSRIAEAVDAWPSSVSVRRFPIVAGEYPVNTYPNATLGLADETQKRRLRRYAERSGTCVSPIVEVRFRFDRPASPDDGDDVLEDAAALADVHRRLEELLGDQVLGPVELVIEGHTDKVGSARYNLALSERRAAWVAERLRGLRVDRVVTRGYGETLAGAGPERDPTKRRAVVFLRGVSAE